MALTKSNQHGAQYKWGFGASDAPTIGNFTARGAELKYGPEVVSTATDGEGHVDAVCNSKPVNRMIKATFTGYVLEGFDPTSLPDSFTFENRFYIIDPDGIGVPRPKGAFWEVSISATSWAGVTS